MLQALREQKCLEFGYTTQPDLVTCFHYAHLDDLKLCQSDLHILDSSEPANEFKMEEFGHTPA